MIQKQKVVRWLQLSFWLGAGVDFVVGAAMLFPGVGLGPFGLDQIQPDPAFRFALALGAALMFGWTVILLWAERDPLERKGVLVITVFPTIFGLAGAVLYAVTAGLISYSDALLTWIVQILLILIFTGSYLNAVRYQKERENPYPHPYR